MGVRDIYAGGDCIRPFSRKTLQESAKIKHERKEVLTKHMKWILRQCDGGTAYLYIARKGNT